MRVAKDERILNRQIDVWLDGRYGFPFRVLRWIKSVWFNLVWANGYQRTRWHIISYILKAATPASAPILSHFFIGNLSLRAALYMAGAISVLAFGANWVERKINSPSIKDPFPKEMLRRIGEITSGLHPEATPPDERDHAKRACLTLIELYVRAQFRLPEKSVGVSLILYNGSSSTELRVDARNLGNERVNKRFRGHHVLGHHACRAGPMPRAVADLREFNKLARKSPTGSTVSYRSFFLIPVGEEVDEIYKPKGYISIDATRPYVFYGNNAEVVAVDCEVIVNHLMTLV